VTSNTQKFLFDIQIVILLSAAIVEKFQLFHDSSR